MQNARVPAAATGLPAAVPTRRAALAALAGAGAALSLPKAARAMPAAGSASDFAPLWLAFLRAQGALSAIMHAQNAAEARLPWWVKPGPSKIDHEGNPCGPVSSSPAKQGVVPASEAGRHRTIRYGAADIEAHYRSFFGPPSLQAIALANRDKGLAELNERKAAAEAERAKVGLHDLEEQWELAADVLNKTEEAIRACHGLDALAAQILLAVGLRCGLDETAQEDGALEVGAVALAGLLPHLSGDLAADAAEVAQNPARPLKLMRVSQGIGPDGRRVLA